MSSRTRISYAERQCFSPFCDMKSIILLISSPSTTVTSGRGYVSCF